jgi:hypothetical protein
MLLSKLLERGERITVIVKVLSYSSSLPAPAVFVIRARVRASGHGSISYRNVDNHGPVGSSVKRRDEGKTWARGWDGPDADVLHATYLLQGSV